jgi:hypothetical protein
MRIKRTLAVGTPKVDFILDRRTRILCPKLGPNQSFTARSRELIGPDTRKWCTLCGSKSR